MINILPSRGCIYSFSEGINNSGFYRLSPGIASSLTAPVLILGCSLHDPDTLVPVATLDNFKVIYNFGKGFGQVNILGMALLGNETSSGEGFAGVVSWFNKHRTSELEDTVKLSLPGGVAYNIFVSALAVGQTDPKFNTQQFMIGGIVADQHDASKNSDTAVNLGSSGVTLPSVTLNRF